MLRQNLQDRRARQRQWARTALAALLTASMGQTADAGDALENPFIHARPPLPVTQQRQPEESGPVPARQNPFCEVPAADELVTLTAGKLPQKAALHRTTTQLRLRPIDPPDAPQKTAQAGRAAAAEPPLSAPRENGFVLRRVAQAAPSTEPAPSTQPASRSEPLTKAADSSPGLASPATPAATTSAPETSGRKTAQASFDAEEKLTEVDGAVTFSLSDLDEPAAKPAPQQKADTASAPEKPPQPRHPSPLQEAAPLVLEPIEAAAEAKQTAIAAARSANAPAKRAEAKPITTGSKRADQADLPVPQLLRPAAPVLTANDAPAPVVPAAPGARANATETNKPAAAVPLQPLPQLPAPEPAANRQPSDAVPPASRSASRAETTAKPAQNASATAPGQPKHSPYTERAPIVVDRKAVSKIGQDLPGDSSEAALIRGESSLVIDVPEDITDVIDKAPAGQPNTTGSRMSETSAEDLWKAVDRSQASSGSPAQADPTAAKPAIARVAAASPSSRPSSPQFQQTAAKAQEVSVAAAGIAALPFSDKVACFAVEDRSICQIVATREDELRVLGQQEGQTRIAVWLGPRESTTPQIFQVQVTASEAVDETTLALAANKLNHSLTQTFPGAQVHVIAGDGKLTVHGTTQGDEKARRIMRLIRQACLVPVIDKIVVR